MEPITIEYPFTPYRRSFVIDQISDLFGLSMHEEPLRIATNLQLDIQPTDVVLFTGPSGSGKSSIMRAVGNQQQAINAMTLELPTTPLIESLPGTLEERLGLLSACGLSEARLFLRTPAELSDGQRYRYRLAYAFAQNAPMLMADEFAAYLDRPLAKVLSYNLRKWATSRRTGFLLATTHDDITADLSPDVHVMIDGMGNVTEIRQPRARERRNISFASELTIVDGSMADWPAFARWHYRSHHVAFVKRVVVLKHQQMPIGICIFTTPAAALRLRHQYFGIQGKRTRFSLHALNQQLWLLSRVVIHPTYRGAGLASWFVRAACASCPVPWIETLTAMGQINPFFEHAGFTRVGTVAPSNTAQPYGGHYGGNHQQYTTETARKSQHSQPVYLVFDNRSNVA